MKAGVAWQRSRLKVGASGQVHLLFFFPFVCFPRQRVSPAERLGLRYLCSVFREKAWRSHLESP